MLWIPRRPQESLLKVAGISASSPVEIAAAALEREAHLSPIVARLLALRGISTVEQARSFLEPSLAQLHSPYLMCGMKAAVERLRAAIAKHEKILIYGDYDVDGTMAVVILKTVIELCGGQCDFHVPHRLLEGYGMRDEVIERAAAEGVTLIISVDTGIRAFAAAETAERLGLDLIVTDHHLPQGESIPHALAVLNPNQIGCEYPCKALCGAGVAFKVAQALLEETGRGRLILSFLKIVAIATIADAVPLIDENRVFVKLGLEGLSHPVNAGLKALLKLCELNRARPLTASEVAFRIAPRMNAAGRMDVARDVIDLFTVRDPQRAQEIALHLNQLNGDRQEEEARISDAIRKQVDESSELRDAYCIVVGGEQWHRGVIGICASRVVERYCRPALVIAVDGPEAHGSGRSISSFHLLNALESCPELFTRFGGHAHAVGFALPTEAVPELRRRLDAYARQHLTEADFVPEIEFDAEIGLEDVNPNLWEALTRLEPFGMGNPTPKFLARNARVLLAPRIMKEKHIKLSLGRKAQGDPRGLSRGIDGLGWRMAERLSAEPLEIGDMLDVVFTVERNNHPDFGGGLQLNLCDFAMAAKSSAASAAGS
ncbi:MAG TPA: single-stranded-DNA-specific exonuclease RecJ [Clostridia bacterium]|nr:single-stranded-DNA-specific exonuclease RecJ [Clostridia bacterium]